jgi:hypothetical protein
MNESLLRELFREEFQDLKINKNININDLEDEFLNYLKIDFYDWFKSNYNYFIKEKFEN